MHLSWYGQSCFKIDTKSARIVIDPFDRAVVGLTPPKAAGVDIAVFTHKHKDHRSEAFQSVPFRIEGPGEYEVKGVHFYGFPVAHDIDGGKSLRFSTAFLIETEDMKVVHLGDFGGATLTNGDAEEMGDVDILLIPVGGTYTLDGEAAAKFVRQIEPRVVIPMHYKVPGLKIALDGPEEFLRDMGALKKEKLPKLVAKKKDLPQDGTDVVVLELATGE